MRVGRAETLPPSDLESPPAFSISTERSSTPGTSSFTCCLHTTARTAPSNVRGMTAEDVAAHETRIDEILQPFRLTEDVTEDVAR
jgi:hypothetical protein